MVTPWTFTSLKKYKPFQRFQIEKSLGFLLQLPMHSVSSLIQVIPYNHVDSSMVWGHLILSFYHFFIQQSCPAFTSHLVQHRFHYHRHSTSLQILLTSSFFFPSVKLALRNPNHLASDFLLFTPKQESVSNH